MLLLVLVSAEGRWLGQQRSGKLLTADLPESVTFSPQPSMLDGDQGPGSQQVDPMTFSWKLLGPYGGEARRLAVDVHQAGVCYLGTADGQVYRSSDGGRSWELLQPGLPHRGFSIEALAVDVRDSRRLYLAGWFVRGGDGGGMYVSEDGGHSWVLRPGMRGRMVRALVQLPSRPEIILAGALDGVYESRDGGHSWRRISPNHPEFKNVESLAVDPDNPQVIYAGTWHLPWKTTDGGKTWSLIGHSAVGMADDSDIFSILVDHRNPNLVYMGTCTGIYRSDNGGQSWRKIQGIPPTSRRTHVIRQLVNQPAVLLAGTTQGLWQSNDQGRHWQLVTARNLVIHDIAFPRAEGDIILLATNQGIFRREGGTPFVASNRGFSHWAVADVRVDLENPHRLYAGLISAGYNGSFYVSEDHGNTWRELGTGLSGNSVFTILQLHQAPEVIYVGTDRGLYASDKSGRWRLILPKQVVNQSPEQSKVQPASRTGQRWLLSAAVHSQAKVVALAPFLEPGEALLLTEQALYRVRLEQGIWTVLYQSQTGERLSCVTSSRHTRGVIYLGSNKGLRVSFNAGRTWEWIEPVYHVQAIAEGAAGSGVIYVGTSLGLFQLQQRGRVVSWTRCGHGLPPISVSAIAINPHNASEIVVGDQRHGGLYHSLDGGGHWRRIDSGFASARVSKLSFDGQSSTQLYVGTLNGGTYLGKRLSQLAVTATAGEN